MRQRADGVEINDPSMIEYLLKFSGGFGAAVQGQVSLAAKIDRIKRAEDPNLCAGWRAHLIRHGDLQQVDCLGRLAVVQCQDRAKRWQVVEFHEGVLWEALCKVVRKGSRLD